MPIYDNPEMSPREYIIMEAEKEEARLARQHAIAIKQLELAIKKEDNQAKVELKKLEAKWSSWLKIPILIVKLPLLIVLGIAYIFALAFKQEPPKRFWELLL